MGPAHLPVEIEDRWFRLHDMTAADLPWPLVEIGTTSALTLTGVYVRTDGANRYWALYHRLRRRIAQLRSRAAGTGTSAVKGDAA